VVTLGCFGAALLLAWQFQRYGVSIAAVDRSAVHDWLGGETLYAGRIGTVLTPPAALLFAPVTFLPLPVVGWLLAVAGVSALVLALIALVGPVARRYGKARGPAVAAAVVLALLTEPVRATVGLGCLDLIVFGLVTADIVALRRSAWTRSRAAWWPGPPASQPPRRTSVSLRGRSELLRRFWATGAWAGVGVGVATALTVSPVLFLAYLVVSRQWRPALTAAATTVSMLAGALLIAPGATVAWFGSVLPNLDRAGPLDALANQSLAGMLARLYDSANAPVLIWLSFAGLLVAVGMIRARSAHADGDEIAAFTLVGLTGAAVGPVSRIHELVWVLPAILILIDAAARRRIAVRRFRRERFPGARFAVTGAVVYALFVVDPRWTATWNAYVIALILLLNALPWRPGVAPAVPARRQPQPVARRAPAIPGPRGS
jgi:alpha-1,2-mannosyltransferase